MSNEPLDLGSKSISLDVTFTAVSPDLLAILTGGGAPIPSFAVEVHAPIKRTFWQWLTRKPRRYRTTYIPHAVMGEADRG